MFTIKIPFFTKKLLFFTKKIGTIPARKHWVAKHNYPTLIARKMRQKSWNFAWNYAEFYPLLRVSNDLYIAHIIIYNQYHVYCITCVIIEHWTPCPVLYILHTYMKFTIMYNVCVIYRALPLLCSSKVANREIGRGHV